MSRDRFPTEVSPTSQMAEHLRVTLNGLISSYRGYLDENQFIFAHPSVDRRLAEERRMLALEKQELVFEHMIRFQRMATNLEAILQDYTRKETEFGLTEQQILQRNVSERIKEVIERHLRDFQARLDEITRQLPSVMRLMSLGVKQFLANLGA